MTNSTASSSPTQITIFIDGLNEPSNPGGWACWAYVAVDATGRELGRNYGCLGHHPDTTNNQAEYHALVEALARAKISGWNYCVIKSDSQLVVKQVNGDWRCNAPTLQEYRAQAIGLIQKVNATLVWIPREQNERADYLSRIAYKKARAES